MATRTLSQYEEELLREIRHIPSSYIPNLIEIVKLFRDSVSESKQKKEEDSSLEDDMAPQELDALLDIQASYESKDQLREFRPMQVDFDRIEFESFPKSRNESESQV